MKPVIIIRPQPGASATLAAARAMNLNAHVFPMFQVHPMPWDMPDAESFDALLLGSANAVRHGGAALSTYAGKPTYAVGEITAQTARDAGLDVIQTGTGGLQDVLGTLTPDHRRLLRLAGKQRVELTAPNGVSITECEVYSSDPLPMPGELTKILARPALVMLHSAEAARHFAASCETRGIDRSMVMLACIGPRVADAAGNGWQDVRAAAESSEKALLALAREMCKETRGSQNDEATTEQKTEQAPMQDQIGSQMIPPPNQPKRSVRSLVGVGLLAFLLGALAVAWLVWDGRFNVPPAEEPAPAEPVEATQSAETPATETPDSPANIKAVSGVEARLAMLEDRFSRLNLQANAASGNAARAESLLIAFAARRMIDRGEPLRYLEDQLRLRFTNAQPRAVDTIIDFGKAPVTIDELSARLDALTPRLTGKSDDESFWDKASRELSGLFTVRTEPSSLLSPEARLERARVMLTAGKIPEAVDQVQRLPGADAADRWVADALRYESTRKALDLIETTAMLDPSRLQDSEGNKVDQPSPFATPPEDKKAPAKN